GPTRCLRDRARRAWLLALRRATAAHRDRAGDPREPRGARARRRDLCGRRDQGARDPRGAHHGHEGAHDPRDRPPAGDHRAGGPSRDSRGRSDRRGRDPRRAAPALDPLPHIARPRRGGLVEKASARTVWQHASALLRPVRTLYLGAAVAVTLSTAITLAGPALVRYAVDSGIRKHETNALNVAAIVFLGLALVKPFVVRAQILMTARAGERFLHALRNAAFDKLLALPLGFFEQQRAGVLVSRLTSDVQSLDELVREALVEITGSGLQILLT